MDKSINSDVNDMIEREKMERKKLIKLLFIIIIAIMIIIPIGLHFHSNIYLTVLG